MARRGILTIALVLASVPWQGVAYQDHTGWRRGPLGNTGYTVMHRWTISICIHMDWPARRMMRPELGSLKA